MGIVGTYDAMSHICHYGKNVQVEDPFIEQRYCAILFIVIIFYCFYYYSFYSIYFSLLTSMRDYGLFLENKVL